MALNATASDASDDETAATSDFLSNIRTIFGFAQTCSIYSTWGNCWSCVKRCHPHKDPCQLWYISGFHWVARHQRLRMCVKSLLDGRQQPQRLHVILQRSHQNHRAASTGVSCETRSKRRVWNGQRWKVGRSGSKFLSGNCILQLRRCSRVTVAVKTWVGSSCVGYVHTAS